VCYEVHGVLIGRYSADLVGESKVNVEAKTARSIDTAHLKQAVNYLKASKLEVGLAINFGPTPQFKRVVYSSEHRAKDDVRRRLWEDLVRRSAFPERHTHPSAPRLLLPLTKRSIDNGLLNRVGNGTPQRPDLLVVARRVHAIRQQHY
jgi:hypothetical protein